MLGRKTPRQICNDRLDAWAERIVRKTGIDLHVHGRDAIPRDENFVVMSNHQSLYDIPILFRALPQTLRMVAKSELFKSVSTSVPSIGDTAIPMLVPTTS